MDALADFYLDYAGWIFLAAFAVATAVLLAAARDRLPDRWWVGAGLSAVVMLGLTTLIALALRGINPDGTVPAEGWLAVAFAGVLGFFAGLDVQAAWALLRGDRPGLAAVVASVILGPAVIVGGYLLLNRSTEWVRLG